MKTIYQKIIVSLLVAIPTMAAAQSNRAFSKHDMSLSAGSTGIGIDFSTNITDWMDVRAGFDVMPRFEQDVRFGIVSMDDSGNFSDDKFSLLNEKLT